jgi:hypothetical protein
VRASKDVDNGPRAGTGRQPARISASASGKVSCTTELRTLGTTSGNTRDRLEGCAEASARAGGRGDEWTMGGQRSWRSRSPLTRPCELHFIDVTAGRRSTRGSNRERVRASKDRDNGPRASACRQPAEDLREHFGEGLLYHPVEGPWYDVGQHEGSIEGRAEAALKAAERAERRRRGERRRADPQMFRQGLWYQPWRREGTRARGPCGSCGCVMPRVSDRDSREQHDGTPRSVRRFSGYRPVGKSRTKKLLPLGDELATRNIVGV